MRSVKVYLVGSGPGDPYLLTLKAKAILTQSDIVLYDNLVSSEVLDFIPSSAKKIFVGKRSNISSPSQADINQILLKEHHLLANKKKPSRGIIVRLKGGDPLVFGRAIEEINSLIAQKIPFEIVPGISSFQGGMTFGGIPFTDRNNSSSFAVVTGHYKKGDESKEIQTSNADTLLYMMGMNQLPLIVEANLKSGRPPQTPMAIIENASRLNQRVVTGNLNDIEKKAKKKNFKPPCIIVIGRVVSLRKICDWWSFRPLHGKTILLAKDTKTDDRDLKQTLEMEGAKVIEKSVFSWKKNHDHHQKLTHLLKKKNILLFSTALAVHQLMEWIEKENNDIRMLHHSLLVSCSEEAKQSLAKYHLKIDMSYKTLIKKKPNTPIILITPFDKINSRHSLWLRENNCCEIELYHLITNDLSREMGQVDVISLFSPLLARSLSSQLKKHYHLEIICRGKDTEKALSQERIPVLFSSNANKNSDFLKAYINFLENKVRDHFST